LSFTETTCLCLVWGACAVTGCKKLRDTEFFSRQDPYVIVEYANTKLRTSTCTGQSHLPLLHHHGTTFTFFLLQLPMYVYDWNVRVCDA
jgi:hypothetical protein